MWQLQCLLFAFPRSVARTRGPCQPAASSGHQRACGQAAVELATSLHMLRLRHERFHAFGCLPMAMPLHGQSTMGAVSMRGHFLNGWKLLLGRIAGFHLLQLCCVCPELCVFPMPNMFFPDRSLVHAQAWNQKTSNRSVQIKDQSWKVAEASHKGLRHMFVCLC